MDAHGNGRNFLHHDDCQQLTVDEDPSLPSKSVYLVRPNGDDTSVELYWAVDYVHDKLRKCGENRALYKWRSFFSQCIEQSGLVSNAFACNTHFAGRELPPQALAENVASSNAVLTYYFRVLETSRTRSLTQQVTEMLSRISTCVCEALCHDADSPHLCVDIPLENGSVLQLCPQSGMVDGLRTWVSARHRTALEAWSASWSSMRADGLLTCLLTQDATTPLKDVLMFASGVSRFRKKKGQSPWEGASPSGSMLRALQRGLISFLSGGLLSYIVGQYQIEHNVSKAAPSRKTSTGGRVSMSVDAIWDLLQHSSHSVTSAREVMNVIGPGSRLSQAGGCTESAVDNWSRRRQILYDERMSYSICGARHYNLCADASTHSGKEVLVSVLWCHQNNCAAFPSVQVLLSVDSVAPMELELTSSIEQLAKDNVQKDACFSRI